MNGQHANETTGQSAISGCADAMRNRFNKLMNVTNQ